MHGFASPTNGLTNNPSYIYPFYSSHVFILTLHCRVISQPHLVARMVGWQYGSLAFIPIVPATIYLRSTKCNTQELVTTSLKGLTPELLLFKCEGQASHIETSRH